MGTGRTKVQRSAVGTFETTQLRNVSGAAAAVRL